MPSPLISAQELHTWCQGNDPDAVPALVDVRWTLGQPGASNRADYLGGHLPAASFLDLESGLSGAIAPDGHGGRHPMPSLAAATEAFRAAGIDQDRPVVFYDAAQSLAAARAWWVMSYFGHRDVYVLDGGLAAWTAAGYEMQSGSVEIERGDVHLTPGHRELRTANDVLAGLDAGIPSDLVDARPAARYRGETEPIDHTAGHIPGALNLPTLSLVTEDGRFRTASALADMFTQAGIGQGQVSTYCGSGVQAAHLALALEAAGHEGSTSVYIGSWSDWISDSTRPIATGN